MSATPELVTPALPVEIVVTGSRVPSTPLPGATILRYLRIRRDHELKRTVKSFWKGNLSVEGLKHVAAELCGAARSRLTDLGLAQPASVPADFVLYDQVLQVTATLGVAPARFRDLPNADGALDVEGCFILTRGGGARPAMEMTKWLDSNYHYLVPEIDTSIPIDYTDTAITDQVREARAARTEVRPVVVGPVSYLLMAKPSDETIEDFHPLDRLSDVLHVYGRLLMGLHEVGAIRVQLDESALVPDLWNVERQHVFDAVCNIYTWLGAIVECLQILAAGTYGSPGDALPVLVQTPIEALSLDLMAGALPETGDLAALENKTVVTGVVSGRNIRRIDLNQAMDVLEQLRECFPESTPITVTTSTSLQHVPHDIERETAIDPEIHSWLVFADQEVGEIIALTEGLEQGHDAIAAELPQDADLHEQRVAHLGVHRDEVRVVVGTVTDADRARVLYGERRTAQDERLNLPEFPTATIGSLPWTAEIREVHAAWREGEIGDAAYDAVMRAEIVSVVALQEHLGLDVLVHGEAECNDMVQYFAELLNDFVTTKHDWVQSHGSRCTRPSILWGDTARPEPMTVTWSAYAQSPTDKPLKGMLTGPMMIIAWSFVRDDIPRTQITDQLDLALRTEVADLKAAGIGVVQVDKPVIRETLPPRCIGRPAYLEWSVGSFRLATGGATPVTQIYIHLRCSEFNIIIDAVNHLDTDATSIEASRSHMDILPVVAEHGLERQLGPGVWDTRSSRVPSQARCTELLRQAVNALSAEKVQVDPDCGLKARSYTETRTSLTNLVGAASAMRETQ